MASPQIHTNDAFQYHWMVWKITGIRNPNGFPKRLYMLYAILINLFVTILFPLTLILNLFHTDGLQEVCENLTITITDTIANFKFLNVYFVRSKLLSIKDIVDKLDIRARNKADQQKVLGESVRIARATFKIFWGLYSFGTFLSLCKIAINSDKSLLFPAWFPLDWRNSTLQYSIVLVYQFFGLVVQAIQDVANDSYPSAYLCILTGHLRALALRVKKIGKKGNDLEANYAKLIECIRDHQAILELHVTIQGIISTACLAQFICSGLVQCTVGIYVLFIIGKNEISSLMLSGIFFFAVTLESFVICYFGHNLKQESEDLTNAIYDCNWTNQLPKFKKTLLFFMMRTHKHNVILAGNYIPVDFPTFVMIMKYSYSVFTLLVRLK
ncbi:odorant receptor 2a [Eupeodes corollae]|uniref:odorant receptor 2a n=1 Tax=Eupeodes corollae TaxID=290404 RepID=UPI002492881D|nr:odorant receptor 2a [Eupeodes corollae]